MRQALIISAASIVLVVLGMLVLKDDAPPGPSPRRDEPSSGDADLPPLPDSREQPDPRTAGLTFRVLDATDRTVIPGLPESREGCEPIAGARVRLFERADQTDWSRVVLESATDAQGLARFEGMVAGGRFAATVEAVGFGGATVYECRVTEERSTRDVLLVPPVVLDGRVLDALTGEVVPGARAAIHEGPVWMSSLSTEVEIGRRRCAAVSGDDGAFALPDAGTGWNVLLVEAEGYAPIRKWLRGDLEPIRLIPAASLVGRVTDPDGRPVAGARVVVSGSGWFPTDPDSLWARSDSRAFLVHTEDLVATATTRTDAQGRYRLTGLSCAETIRVRAEGDGYVRSHTSRVTTLRPGSTATLDLRLHRGARLVLRVRRTDGHPVPSPRVSWRFLGDPHPYQTPSRKDSGVGVVEFEGLVPGRYEAQIWGPGCYSTDPIFELRDGETQERTVVLESSLRSDPVEPVTIVGRVIDDSARPVAGARVRCDPAEFPPTRTAEDGSFTIRAPGGRLVTLSASAEAFFPWSRQGAEFGEEPVEIHLWRRGLLRIPLVAPPGSTPATVRIDRVDPGGTTDWREDWPAGGVLSVAVASASRVVFLSVPGFLPIRVPVDVRPGEMRDVPAVRFEVGATIEVRVLGPDDAPVAGASVTIWQDTGSQSGETDGDGRARIGGLVAGSETRGWVMTPGGAVLIPEFTLEDGADPILVRILPAVTIEGEVRDESGLPFAYVDVSAETTFPGDEKVEVIEDRREADNAGRFRFELRPGHYRILLRPPGTEKRDADVRELDVTRAGSLILTIPRR